MEDTFILELSFILVKQFVVNNVDLKRGWKHSYVVAEVGARFWSRCNTISRSFQLLSLKWRVLHLRPNLVDYY